MKQLLTVVMLLALFACGWAVALPEQGLGDNWVTEDHQEPGIVSDWPKLRR